MLRFTLLDVDDNSLMTLAKAIHEDEAAYLLDAIPLPDLSGSRGNLEDEVVVSAVRNGLRSLVNSEGVLSLDLVDDQASGECAELEPQATLAALRDLPRTQFVFLRGEEVTRGERIPAYAEVRIGAETWHAPIRRHDGEWRAYVPDGRNDLEHAVMNVNAALGAGI